LNYIFKNGFIDGTIEIINQYLGNEYVRETFKCFEQKKNMIYVFDEEWKECKTDDFNKIYNIIYNKMLVTFDVYKTENESKLRDERFQTEYSDNFMKLLCVNIPVGKKITRIKNKIYSEFKEHFKTITELEI
jgi:3-oxoacyl-ACP reductase-like protein